MAKEKDVSYLIGERGKFNLRVGAVVKNGDKYMLCHNDGDSYWWLLGGRVELNTTTEESLKREFLEETGVKLKKKDYKLIRICENFFSHNEKDFHEILFIYLVENKELNKKDNFRTLDKPECTNKWLTKEEISKLEVRPNAYNKWINDFETLKHEIIK